MSHRYFFSYARANTKWAADSELMRRFREALEAEVDQLLGAAGGDSCFFDSTDIEAGAEWPAVLTDSLCSAKVAVCLYSPNYFNSSWCGKEVRVFLDRAAAAPGPEKPTAIIPVIWMPVLKGLPAPIAKIQTHDEAFPAAYPQIGLRQVMNVGSPADFFKVVSALAQRIATAVQADGLPPLQTLDLATQPSAWDVAINADPGSHKKGGITKTCFVFAARDGWDWKPYPGEPAIGALAQAVSGQLGLRYEELPCDSKLPDRLRETLEHDVPTVVFADPSSASVQPFETALRRYDQVYFLNCGLIVPWERATPPPSTDARWLHIQRAVCPQKAVVPPPHHDWLTTVSPEDLKARSAAVIESIRGQLLKKVLSSDTAVLTRAEDSVLVKDAEQKGVRLDVVPQLNAPSAA